MLLSLHKSNFANFNKLIESKERRKWRKTSDKWVRKGGESNNYKSDMKSRRERIKLEGGGKESKRGRESKTKESI